MIDSEQTLCSCAEICKHKKKIDVYTCCASDNYNCLHALDPEHNEFLNFGIPRKIDIGTKHMSDDPIDQLIDLLENPRVKTFFEDLVNSAVEKKIKESYKTPEFKGAVETVIVTSDLEIPSRLRAVEKVTGTYNFEEWEKHEPTIPEQIPIIEEKIENLAISTPILPLELMAVIPETKTEARAVFLVEYLNKEVEERNGEFFLNGSEIKEFLTKIIPDRYNPDFTVKKDQNIRKLKKDVITKAKQLFPNNLFVNKNKNGRHETRILFKPSPTVTS